MFFLRLFFLFLYRMCEYFDPLVLCLFFRFLCFVIIDGRAHLSFTRFDIYSQPLNPNRVLEFYVNQIYSKVHDDALEIIATHRRLQHDQTEVPAQRIVYQTKQIIMVMENIAYRPHCSKQNHHLTHRLNQMVAMIRESQMLHCPSAQADTPILEWLTSKLICAHITHTNSVNLDTHRTEPKNQKLCKRIILKKMNKKNTSKICETKKEKT